MAMNSVRVSSLGMPCKAYNAELPGNSACEQQCSKASYNALQGTTEHLQGHIQTETAQHKDIVLISPAILVSNRASHHSTHVAETDDSIYLAQQSVRCPAAGGDHGYAHLHNLYAVPHRYAQLSDCCGRHHFTMRWRPTSSSTTLKPHTAVAAACLAILSY